MNTKFLACSRLFNKTVPYARLFLQIWTQIREVIRLYRYLSPRCLPAGKTYFLIRKTIRLNKDYI